MNLGGVNACETKLLAHCGDESERVFAVGADSNLWIAHEDESRGETELDEG